MAEKDLMFKIAILDETKGDLKVIQDNLKNVQAWANGAQQSVQSVANSFKEIRRSLDVKLPSLDPLVQAAKELHSLMGLKDADKIGGLNRMMDAITQFNKVLSKEPISASDVRDNLKSLSDNVDKGIRDMSKATITSLEGYRDRFNVEFAKTLNNIGNLQDRILAALDHNGKVTTSGRLDMRKLLGLEDATKTTDAQVDNLVKSLSGRLPDLQSEITRYSKAIGRNVNFTGELDAIIGKIGEIESAITSTRAGLSNKGMFGEMPAHTNEGLEAIISKLKSLDEQLKNFGNGNYDGVMKGFINAVKSAVGKVEEALKPLNGARLDIVQTQPTKKQTVTQGTLDFNPDGMVQPLTDVQRRIGEIIEKIKEAVKNGLSEALNTDISGTKTVQGLQELATGLNNMKDSLEQAKKITTAFKEIQETLQKAKVDLKAVSNGGTAKDANGNEAQKQAEDMRALVRNINIVVEALDKVKAALAEVQGYRERIRFAGRDTADVDKYIDRLESLKNALSDLSKDTGILSNGGLILTSSNEAIKGTADALKALKDSGTLTGEQLKKVEEYIDKIGNTTPKGIEYRRLLEGARGYKQVAEDAEAAARAQSSADTALSQVTRHINQLKEVSRNGVSVGVDVTRLNEAIAALQRYQRVLEFISQRGGWAGGVTAESLMATKGYQEASAAANRYLQEIKGVIQANKELAHSENTVAQAIANATNAGRQQSQVLSDLKSMAAQYLSVWGAQQFISDMTNITGELELQRKSLEVILGSGTAAAEMYAQLRDLSQQSPYTFEDLLKAHRQLAAFGIEAKNIYGTMKSLTDIGAGLDVPVERLILAYGHTKSYGYLSGIQNRQFETAGIDLVGALSDLYNRRADAAKAKGQTANYRSRKDIFALMRKREIPFEDVEEVIMDLDKPDGKFYNMQERQYETLGGKLRNLRNNYRIMQSEMGGSNRNILMGIVDTINNVTEHWERYAAILRDVVVAYGSVRLAGLAMGKQVTSTSRAMQQAVRNTVAMARSTNYLNTMNYGHWENGRQHLAGTNPTKLPLASTMRYNAQWDAVKEIAQNKEINNFTKQRIALTAQLTKAQRAYLLTQSGIEKAQARYIAGLSPLRRGLISVSFGFRQAAMAARAFMATMATQFAIMAPIMAITELIGRTREQTRKADALAKDFREQSETNRKSAEEILNNYASRGIIDLNQGTKYDASGMRLDTNNIIFNDKALEGLDLTSDIEELKKKLQVLSPLYDGDLLDINKFETQKDLFKAIIDKIEAIRRANQVQESIASDLANADKRVAGNYAVTRAFGDTFTEDMQDYMQSYRNMRNDLQKEFTDLNSNLYTSDANIEKIDQVTGGALTALKNGYGLTDYREALAVYFRKIAQMSEQERNKALGRLQGVTLNNGSSARDLYESVANPWFGKNLDTQFRQMENDAKEWSKTLGNDIISQFAGDPESAVAAMMNSVNTFTATVTDPSLKQEIIDKIIESLNDKYNGFTISGSYGGQNLQNEALGNLYAEALTKQQFAQYLNGLTGEMSDAEGLKVFDDAFNKIQTYIKQHNYKFAALGKDSGKSWFKGMYDGAFNSLKVNSAWQKRAMKAITIDQELKVNIKSAVDIYAFAEDVQKKIKEARDRIEKMIPHIKALQVRMGINFNISASTTVAEIAKQRKALEAKLNTNKSTYNLSNEAWQKSAAGQASLATIKAEEELVNEYKKLETDLGSVKEEKKWLTDEGFKDTDEEKRQKKLEEAKRKKEAADRKADQTTINNLESRYNAIKKVYEWYKRWYELLGNSDAAMEAAKNLVDASDIKGINLNDLKSWETYVKLLERERDAVGKTKLRLPKENADRLKQIQTNYTDTIDRGDADEFSRNQDRTASALERQLEVLGKQYDLYKKIYELTGDRDLAVRLSGRNVSDTHQSKADDYKQAIQADLDEARRSLNLEAVNLDFDRLFGMDDEKIKQAVGTTLNIDDEGKVLQNNKQLALQYKAIVDALKKWRDLQEQINNESKETYANLVGGLTTFANALQKADEQFDETIQKLNTAKANGDINGTQYNYARDIADAKRNRTILEASPQYKNLLAGNTSYKPGILQQGGREAIKQLTDMLNDGTISADEYSQKIETINNAMEKLNDEDNTSMFSTFINQGFQGVLDRRLKDSKDEQKVAAQRAEQAASDVKAAEIAYSQDPSASNQVRLQSAQAKSAQAKKDVEEANAKVQANDKSSESYKKFSKAVQDTIKVMGDLNNAVSLLSNVFDSLGLGDTGFGQAASDATDIMGGMLSGASSLSALGPWGMAAGAGLGLISGLAGVHDKHQQRKIDKLQEDVSAIEGYTETISKAQERTLGYSSRGSSSVISGYQQIYNAYVNNGTATSAQKALADYYNAAGSSKGLSVYEQQYNLLVQKRQDYMDMYDAENDKKKKNKDALQEYKEKIAELDDEIRYFSEDLANTLYGIDLKSWADQFGDALMTAFENGEDAADAFDDTVTSILQSLVKKMVSVGVMEPLFDRLRKNLFDYKDENGVEHKGSFRPEDPNGSKLAWMKDISEALGDGGYIRGGIEAAEDIFNTIEGLVNGNGQTLKSANSATMSSSIKGITETTADLLAAYLNAIRADVSVIRQIHALFYNNAWPEYVKQVTASAQSISRIDSNVLAIRQLMSENGALFERINTLRDDLHGLVTQQKYIKVQ